MNNLKVTTLNPKTIDWKTVQNTVYFLKFWPKNNLYVIEARGADLDVGPFKKIATFQDKQKARKFFDNIK